MATLDNGSAKHRRSEKDAWVTGAWLESDDPGDRKFIKIGDLTLESGVVLPDITIAYQTWGELNQDKDNVILVNHAMTGWSDVPGWWPQMVGPGLPFDTNKFYVVCPNVIGGCQGSTGPSSLAPDGKRWGSRFPYLTVRDMVAAEVKFSRTR
jgi:homoserine O-acetyltransferase/O-succinyltransferase